MSYQNILVERRASGVWITLNRPQVLNALNPALLEEARQALDGLTNDPSVRAVVLTGAGRAFCAGGDMKENLALKQKHGHLSIVERFWRPLQDFHYALRALPVPVIAAVNGFCMAGGMETLMACDLVIAAESAQFSDAHARFGLLPALGGAHGLMRAVGPFKAKEIMFTADRYSATQMRDMGVVMEVVADDALQARVEKVVEGIAERSAPGIARMKQMVNEEFEMTYMQASKYETAIAMNHLASTTNHMEGMQAFSQKRAPEFT